MKKDKFDIEKIEKGILDVENEFNKVDEWLIPRDRFSFYLTHDFHPYFAAFPPELVSRLLNQYSKEGDTFLDPFMGGGSSIVEGFIHKRKTIGIDISPLAKFIALTKTTPVKINDTKINLILYEIREDLFSIKSNNYKNFSYTIPDVTNIDKWFNNNVKYELAIILHHLNKIKEEDLKNFLLLAFSSIIRKMSNAKNAQQHLCIKVGKKIPDIYLLFKKKVDLMSQQMKEYYIKLGDISRYELPKVYCYDIKKMAEIIKHDSIDIIITSPPYGTGSRYTDVNRLSFEWLNLIKPRRTDTLETSKEFTQDLKKSIGQMYVVLKRGGYCFFVYGDPSTEKSLTKIAIEDAKSIGFIYEGLISCPIEKTVCNHHEKYRRFIPKDFILIFKKS